MQKNIMFRFSTSLDTLAADIDIEKLELILSNLVSNAYKYTAEGGRVTLTLIANGPTAVIAVADTGASISPDKLQHIFEPYYRIDDGARTEGSGIGLSFAAQLAKECGGTVSVESQVNVGSTFSLSIPIHRAHCEECEATPPILDDLQADDALATLLFENAKRQDTRSTATNPMALRTLLIIDDEPSLLTMLSGHLSQYYHVATATNGYDGLKLSKDLLPDIIICDMMMPGMDGIEFLERIKGEKTLAHIPIIMLTAKSLDDDRIRALEHGAEAYLTKPISLKVLRSHISMLLKKDGPTLHDSCLQTTGARPEQKGTAPQSEDPDKTRKTPVSKEDEKFILRCKEIIDGHLEDQTIDVALLAKEMGMSQSALYKHTKAITGGSTADLILDYKIFKATTFFKAGETNITSIAYKCGFSGIHSFRTAFKSRMGLTPSAYIKNM